MTTFDDNHSAFDIIRDLRQMPERPLRMGYALTEGRTAVRMLLASGHGPVTLFADEAEYSLIDVMPSDAVYHPTTEEQLTRILGFRPHSAIIAIAPVPEVVAVDELPFPVLALNDVSDAINVGAIVRSAVGLGIRSIAVDGGCSDPFLRRAVRTSMGCCFHASVGKIDDLSRFLRDVRGEGRRVAALEQGPDARPLQEAGYRPDVLVVGNEGHGIRPHILSVCDVRLEIPMDLADTSLNVGAATSIALWELWGRHGRS